MGLCKDCTYWGNQEIAKLIKPLQGYRYCCHEKVAFSEDVNRGPAGLFVNAFFGYPAEVVTGPEFGCVKFGAKK